MRKTNLIKVFLILTITMMVVLFNTSVFADNNTGFNDLTSTLDASNGSSGNTNSNTNNSNTNRNTNKNTNRNTNRNINTNRNTNSTSSSYNNTNSDLPYTGVEDSIPYALLIVVFGISAIYAYRKINYYKNI